VFFHRRGGLERSAERYTFFPTCSFDVDFEVLSFIKRLPYRTLLFGGSLPSRAIGRVNHQAVFSPL